MSVGAGLPPPAVPASVVIAGGTGFVGSALVSRLLALKVPSITVLSRSAQPPREGVTHVVWAPSTGERGWESCLEGAEAVINLAGAPVVSRWSTDGMAEIMASRQDATSSLVAGMERAGGKAALVSASAVGYYGSTPSGGEPMTEDSPPADDDFLADLCVSWEKAANAYSGRVVIARLGVVLGVGGGALAKMLPAFKVFAGGPVGSGSQVVSWVSLEDVVDVLITAAASPDYQGVYNLTAEKPVTMKEMAGALGKALKRPSLLPVPGAALTALYGQGARVVLEGQRVLPTRLGSEGWVWRYGEIDDVMKHVAEQA